MASPPTWPTAANMSAVSPQARSQVGWREAVASIANSSLPGRPPAVRTEGSRFTRARNAATSALAGPFPGLSGRFGIARKR